MELFPVSNDSLTLSSSCVFICSLSFSSSFFSLVDLLLSLWRDDANLQCLMGCEQEWSSSSACETMMSSATLGCFTICCCCCFGVCGKNVNSTFQMFSGQQESHKWTVWIRNITNLFRRWQQVESWKHSAPCVSCAACYDNKLYDWVVERVAWLHSFFRTWTGQVVDLYTYSFFLFTIPSASTPEWNTATMSLLISCEANAVLFAQSASQL